MRDGRFRTFCGPAQNEDDPQKYENASVAWLTTCPSDTLFVPFMVTSQTFGYPSVQNEPAARAHQACKAESTHHPFTW